MSHERRFRFAMQLTHAASAADWIALAQRAESSGFAVLSMPDHLGDQFSPLPGLAAAAAVTSRIRLSMFVLANDFRHPGLLAKEATTLDVLSGGRLELGIGAGWSEAEYQALGLRFDSPGVRIERLAEAVQILRAAFSKDPFSFSGKHYSVENLSIRPRPAQAGGIPILIGGARKKMLALAAQRADIISLTAGIYTNDPADLARGYARANVETQLGWVREAAPARFDELSLNIRVIAIAVGSDRACAARALSASNNVPADTLLDSPYALLGTLEDIEAQLKRMRDELGISYFTISQRYAEPFLPLVEKLSGR